MQTNTPFYIKKLLDEFENRKIQRPDYSLRSYAKFIGIDVASLSNVLKGNRRISKKSVYDVATRLNLSPDECEKFVMSNSPPPRPALNSARTLAALARRKLDLETHFRIISEWEHYAILSLIELPEFKPDSKWIAERLGLDEERVRECIQTLFQAELIKGDGEKIVLTHQGLTTSDDVPSQALRKARRQDLELAMSAIEEVSVDARDFSSVTMTVNREDMPELKKSIRDFRRRFMIQAERRKGNEVYKLNIQLLPLTKIRTPNENN